MKKIQHKILHILTQNKLRLFNKNIRITYIIFILSSILFWIINLLLPVLIPSFCTFIDLFSNASISSTLIPLGLDGNIQDPSSNISFMTGSDRNPIMDINFIIDSEQDTVADNADSSNVDNNPLSEENSSQFQDNNDIQNDTIRSEHNEEANTEATLPSEEDAARSDHHWECLTKMEKAELLEKINMEESRPPGTRKTFAEAVTDKEMRWLQERVEEDENINPLDSRPRKAEELPHRKVVRPYTGQVKRYLYDDYE